MEIELRDVYDLYDPNHGVYVKALYSLLLERVGEYKINIGFNRLPTYAEHLDYVASTPYEYWSVIVNAHQPDFVIGAVSIDKGVIGIFIFKDHQKKGYATSVLTHLIERCKGQELVANINTLNEASIKLFEKLGFRHVANIYKFTSENAS